MVGGNGNALFVDDVVILTGDVVSYDAVPMFMMLLLCPWGPVSVGVDARVWACCC